MPTVVVPPHPGLCSAFGCAITEARVDRAQTHYARSDVVDPARVADLVAELCSHYDVTPSRCEADVLPFLTQLHEKGLVQKG